MSTDPHFSAEPDASASPTARWTAVDQPSDLAAEWIDGRERMDRMLAPFGARLLDRAALMPGERVLDIGCGTGATTAAAWSRVAPTGSVLGIDVNADMLTAAHRRLATLAATGVRLLHADAQTHR